MKNRKRAALLVTLALAFGGSAAMAQGGNWSHTGATPPKLPPTVQKSKPQGTLPPAAQAALDRIRETERSTGRPAPAPRWNHVTNDYERNADGSVKFFDNRAEPPPPPCLGAPGGCGPDYNSPPPAFCARLPKGCER